MTDTEAVLALIAAWVLTEPNRQTPPQVFAEQNADALWHAVEATAQLTNSRSACAWRVMTLGRRQAAIWAACDAIEKAVMDPEEGELE